RLAGSIGDGVVLSAGLSCDSVRNSIARCVEGASGRDLGRFRRAGYLFFGTSRNRKEALDAVRQKLAFVMRNKFLGANIKASGIAVDQEAVIAAIAQRDLAAASALVPDEAVEAFGNGRPPGHWRGGGGDLHRGGNRGPCVWLVGGRENWGAGFCCRPRFGGDVMRKTWV